MFKKSKVNRIIGRALEKSKASLHLPSFAGPEKVVEEIAEHFSFLLWTGKRVVIPLCLLYIITGFLFNEHVLGALLTSSLVFLYANFLPDFDAFYSKPSRKKATWVEKRLALFFAPIVIYYLLSNKIAPFDLGSPKAFHSTNAMFAFSIFLFLAGLVLYFSVLKAFFFALFGLLGYATHLFVDKKILS